MSHMTENAIEQYTIDLMGRLGYQYVYAPDIAPDGNAPERDSYSQVFLLGRLRKAINRINDHLPHDIQEHALKEIQRIASPDLVANNKAFHKYLTEGVPVSKNVEGYERGDRLYSESDLETLRLILTLKNEKGLNTTAIRMALANMEESQETSLQTFDRPTMPSIDFTELNNSLRRIVEQNDELIAQNRLLSQKIEALEAKMKQRDAKKEEQVDELIRLWKREQDERPKSWLSRLTGK